MKPPIGCLVRVDSGLVRLYRTPVGKVWELSESVRRPRDRFAARSSRGSRSLASALPIPRARTLGSRAAAERVGLELGGLWGDGETLGSLRKIFVVLEDIYLWCCCSYSTETTRPCTTMRKYLSCLPLFLWVAFLSLRPAYSPRAHARVARCRRARRTRTGRIFGDGGTSRSPRKTFVVLVCIICYYGRPPGQPSSKTPSIVIAHQIVLNGIVRAPPIAHACMFPSLCPIYTHPPAKSVDGHAM